ncbi:hypothetical protein [Pollutibacter soli]|uniref:hypothetical protein n=1 Tax=Pollutibacter soli TaxID=3034157 RepID=UPI003013692A
MKNILDGLKKSFGFTSEEEQVNVPPAPEKVTVEKKRDDGVPDIIKYGTPPGSTPIDTPAAEKTSAPSTNRASASVKEPGASSIPVSHTVSASPSVSTFSRPAAYAKREELIRFILKGLLPYVDEKTRPIAGLRVYYKISDALEMQIRKVALHLDEPVVFQQEYLERKLQNHFIPLDHVWLYEYAAVKDDFPENIFIENDFGLEVLHRGQVGTGPYLTAKLTILRGLAEKKVYQLNPAEQLRFNIGRSKNPKLPSGKIQHNDIAFLEKSEIAAENEQGRYNQHISRNHAYIRFNPQSNKYMLYPDNGGLPENGNKVKIHSGDNIKWLSIANVGHELHNGDQIELGGEALIQFNV